LQSKDAELPSPKDLKNFLYGKVCFRTENYIALTSIAERFDVIFCLSTIKYIHLNFGDLGLKALFLRAYSQLEDNGIFIIDPQPWKSYKKKKKLTEATAANFSTIKLRPHLFKDYLESIGFKLLTTIIGTSPSIGVPSSSHEANQGTLLAKASVKVKECKPFIVYQK
jgi:hypothetical protein